MVGEDGFQGVGYPLVGGQQGRRSGRLAGTIRGSAVVVMDDSRGVIKGVIAAGIRCAIRPIIARRTDPLAARSGVAQVRTTWVT